MMEENIKKAIQNHKEGKIKEASLIFKKLYDNDCSSNTFLYAYGCFCKSTNNITLSKKMFSKSIRKYPEFKFSYLRLSEIYFLEKNLEIGIEFLENSIKLFPNFLPLYFNLAVMYRNNGKINLAIKTNLHIISIDKLFISSYYELSSIYDFNDNQDEFNFLLNIKLEELGTIDRINTCFAISNIYHQRKDFIKSIKYLKIANNDKLKIKPSDLNLKIITGDYFRKLILNHTINYKSNSQHIFIVGMPRSGSTLVEHILSLNSNVTAMGEVNFMEESLRSIKKLEDINSQYKSKIDEHFNFSKIYTNKNLFNFLYCNIIITFFPNSKIINCIRNPFDTIISIYRSNFVNQPFSSSLGDIIQLYIYYYDLMIEYKKKYSNKIFDCNYEELVNNSEDFIQIMIKWLNWEWDKKYLNPQKNKRNVFTASSAQVRKSINNKAIGNWKNYKNLFLDYQELIHSNNILSMYYDKL